jgi:uncharacterized protein YjbI with pentapeptide repeats
MRKTRRDQLRAAPKRPHWINLPTVVSSLTAVAALIFTALSLQTTQQQIAIDAQGEMTSRFTAALNQLSSPSPFVESGAIFALGSIAHDAPYWQPQIIMLLSEFIRQKVPGGGVGRSGSACNPERNKIPEDVTAALTVLRLRDLANDGWATVNLSDTCLDGAPLQGMNLRCVVFNGTSLEDADLRESKLEGADLVGADLKSAFLNGASLVGANLDGAVLGSPSSDEGAQLDSADLDYADLDDADFANASLIKASLNNVVLDYTIFTDAHLNGAKVGPYPDIPTFMKAAGTGRTGPTPRQPGKCHVSPGQ